MGQISVAEAAERLGVGTRRVHQRIADGSLPAELIGHQWVISEADLVRVVSQGRGRGRPLSPRSTWTLAVAAADLDPASPAPIPTNPPRPAEASQARSRLRTWLDPLSRSEIDDESAIEGAARIAQLMAGRAERLTYHVATVDVDDLRDDLATTSSGVSLPISGMASPSMVEAYVDRTELESLREEFLLSPAKHASANVVLHVVDPDIIRAADTSPSNPVVLIADLMDHLGPRESTRAGEVVRECAEAWTRSR